MVKLLIAVVCFAFAGMVVNCSTHGRLFKDITNVPDLPAAQSSAHADPPSTVRVHIGSQVWTCRIEHGSAKGCTLTYSPSARVHS